MSFLTDLLRALFGNKPKPKPPVPPKPTPVPPRPVPVPPPPAPIRRATLAIVAHDYVQPTKPIEGANVQMAVGDEVTLGITNADGYFAVELNTGRQYDVTVSKEGYDAGTASEFLTSNHQMPVALKKQKPPYVVTARPLVGPLRIEHKLFRDDTGYRRVLFCSWFPALRILRDNPFEFERQMDVIAQYYQGFRTFFAVGGWTPYWDGREVAPITFTKWHHSPETGLHRPARLGEVIQGWPDFDPLLRMLLRACRVRSLRVHQSVGDMQIICPDAAGKPKEIELNRRFARICAEEGGLDVMALVGDTNEYPQNHYASDSPESIEQMGKVLRVWEEAIPGILTTMGACISEEMDRLRQSITYGKVCDSHTSRGVPFALKRTHALIHMEGAYRSFPAPFWQGEPMGWGKAVSVDRFDNYTNADGVALYAMHALTGQASNYFNGPAIHSREPLESTWGFREIPTILSNLPEDVATWDHGNNGRGGIEYWWKGDTFATATYKEWDISPPKPIAEWTLYTGDTVVTGRGTPPRVSGLLMGKFQ